MHPIHCHIVTASLRTLTSQAIQSPGFKCHPCVTGSLVDVINLFPLPDFRLAQHEWDSLSSRCPKDTQTKCLVSHPPSQTPSVSHPTSVNGNSVLWLWRLTSESNSQLLSASHLMSLQPEILLALPSKCIQKMTFVTPTANAPVKPPSVPSEFIQLSSLSGLPEAALRHPWSPTI